MKTAFMSLILFSIVSLNTIAQDSAQWGMPEGAKARLGRGIIYEVKYSPAGTRLAVASSCGDWLYDSVSGDPIALMRDGNSICAIRVAFSPDGRALAVAADDIVRLWDTVTGELKHTLRGKRFGDVMSLAFSPDGRTLAVASWDGRLSLWNAATGTHKRQVEGHTGRASCIAFSPNGRTLASGGGVLRLYDVVTGVHIRTLNSPIDGVYGVAYSPDGRIIAGANASEIRLWDAVTGALKHTLNGGSRVAFSLDSRTLAAVRRGEIQLWDAVTGMHKRTLDVPEAAISYIAFTRDGSTLAVGYSTDPYDYDRVGTLRVWDAVTGEHIRTLEGHTGDVKSVALSPDGSALASGSDDGTVLLWDIAVDTVVATIKGDINQDGVVNIQDLVLVATLLGQTGPNIADANGDGIVHILDLALVAGELGNEAAAPSIYSDGVAMLSPSEVKLWLEEARRLALADATIPRGIEYLENLLEALTPERTALLPNFPNPFNPETWIPYQLARESVVRISVYSSKGILVRKLDLGLQPEGFYTDKHYAAYWDGRNEGGELLASGLYIYVFGAGSYRGARIRVFASAGRPYFYGVSISADCVCGS